MYVELSPERLSKKDGDETIVTVYRQGDLVYKLAPSFLTQGWQQRMEQVLSVINIPVFVKFIDGGYVTKYLDGIDLMGDKPFLWRFSEDHGWQLTHNQRLNVINIFIDIIFAGIQTGVYLADFTRRNMMLAKGNIYLIDYDIVATEQQVFDIYLPMWQMALDWLNVPHKVDTDLEAMLDALRKETNND